MIREKLDGKEKRDLLFPFFGIIIGPHLFLAIKIGAALFSNE